MKLKIGDKVYLQKYEVAHILHELGGFPSGFFQETFGDGRSRFFSINGTDEGLRFECVYEDPETVKWLMEQDWIVDYDEYVKIPLVELEVLRERLKAECIAGVNEFNAKDKDYREAHFDEEDGKFEKLRHKIASLGDLIDFREGETDFVFPDEYYGKKPSTFIRRA